MAATTQDLAFDELGAAGYTGDLTERLMNWRTVEGLVSWETYRDYIITNGGVGSNFMDAQYAFWLTGLSSFSPLDLSPALWVDPSDASSVTISGSSGAYIGPSGLVMPGSGINYASAPDIAAYTPSGDIDIKVRVSLADWTPVASTTIVSKRANTTADFGWQFNMTSAGVFYFQWGTSSTTATAEAATTANTLSDGVMYWVRVTKDFSTGSLAFYYAADQSSVPSSWTQIGSTVAGVTGTCYNDSNRIQVGSYYTNLEPASGTFSRVVVVNDSTTVFDADFEAATPYVSAFTESALGAPVYVVSSTATSATANYSYIGPEGLTGANSGGNYATLPANVAYDVEDFEFVARITLTDWDPAGDYRSLYTHGGIFDSTQRLGVRTINRIINLDWYDGTTFRGISSTTAFPNPGDGVFIWIKVTFDYNAGGTYAANFYYAADQSTEPSSWTQIGTQVTGAQASGTRPTNKVVTIASLSTYVARLWQGTIKRVIVRNAIGGSTLIDADFVTAADYAATFTESSANAATVTITATNTPSAAAGALVSQINDLSGNARHLVQATAANMPKYAGVGRNGLNVAAFNATTTRLSAVTAAADWAFLHDGVATYAIYVWFKPTLAATGRCLLGTARGVGGTIGMAFFVEYLAGLSGSFDYVTTTAGALVINMDSNTDLGAYNNWKMGGFENDPANATANLRGVKRLNGVLSGAVNAATGTPTATVPWGPLFVGSDPAASYFYGGDIGEIVIFASPTATQIAAIEAYGIAKWAIV